MLKYERRKLMNYFEFCSKWNKLTHNWKDVCVCLLRVLVDMFYLLKQPIWTKFRNGGGG